MLSKKALNTTKKDCIYLNTETNICRICFNSSHHSDGNALISPCDCSGNSKYIHESCLKKWVIVKFPNPKNSFCEVCLKKFPMKIQRKCRLCNGQSLNPISLIDIMKLICSFLLLIITVVLCLTISLVFDGFEKLKNKSEIQGFMVLPAVLAFLLFGKYIFKAIIGIYLDLEKKKNINCIPMNTRI